MSFLKYISQPANLLALGAIVIAIIVGFVVPEAQEFGYVAIIALAVFLIGSYVRSLKQ
ncbi:hypothetical protein [Pontibacter beigongshangensis]|uniref:hypothetical protein n=1 Tax=Pontibacter beigongshangensis TaxID=2574733 RepID=UPI00165007B1|nr:hypothetical protein [Pontibacter beigongshangensis]